MIHAAPKPPIASSWIQHLHQLEKISKFLPENDSLNPKDLISRLPTEMAFKILFQYNPQALCRMACTSRRFAVLCYQVWSERNYDTQQNRLELARFCRTFPEINQFINISGEQLRASIPIDVADFDHLDKEEFNQKCMRCAEELNVAAFTQFSVPELKTLCYMFRLPTYRSMMAKLTRVQEDVGRIAQLLFRKHFPEYVHDADDADQAAAPPMPAAVAQPVHAPIPVPIPALIPAPMATPVPLEATEITPAAAPDAP